MKENFEPKIIAFLCHWCASAGADLAGVRRLQYPANAVPIRIMCSGRMDPQFVLEAFAKGADGVLIAGCHPGECHYISGNYKTFKRIALLKKLIAQLGIDDRRLRLEWISASEEVKFVTVMREFVKELKELGALKLNKKGG